MCRMDYNSKQEAHWLEVRGRGQEKWDKLAVKYSNEVNELLKRESYDNLNTVNVGGGPFPLRFKNAHKEILLDKGISFFCPLYPSKYVEGMELLNEDVCQNTIPDNSIDICYVRKTLEYITEWKTALKEMKRFLKLGGTIVLIFHEHQNDGINLNLLSLDGVCIHLVCIDFDIVEAKMDRGYVQIVARRKC